MKKTDFIKKLKSLKAELKAKEKHTSNFSPDVDTLPKRAYCNCKDSNGESKYLYTSKKELEYVLSTQTLSLQAYPCPIEKGWHVTKGHF